MRKPVRQFILEQTSPAQIAVTKANVDRLLSIQWRFYSELAFKRAQIEPQLHAALTQECGPYTFDGWQRAVKYRYGLHPFSAVGSLADPGGRFNIGEINTTNYPTFPALYLAKDKATALQETLGQVEPPPGSSLTAAEMALTNPQSQTIVSVSGQLESVFDLRSPKSLGPFVDLLKDFKLSRSLVADALRAGSPLNLARTAKELFDALLVPEWRSSPMMLDVPSTSQIFGQIAAAAGIEGIIYPSKFTGTDCLAIFSRNLVASTGYLKLDDIPPHPKVPVRIDSSNCGVCELGSAAVIAG